MSEIASAIIESATGRPPLSLRPIQGQGASNQVWDAATVQGSLILRLSPYRDTLSCYQKEAWCLDAAAKAGIPSPAVAGTGLMDDTSWMLQTKIGGLPGNLWDGDPVALWQEMGRLAAILNTIPVDGYGWQGNVTDSSLRFTDASWPETLQKLHGYLFSNDFLVREKILTPEQNGAAADMIAGLKAWNFRPVLTHGDLFPKNTIVGDDGMTYLIDYGGAAGGRALFFELNSICALEKDPRLTAAFCDGYGISGREFEVLKAELAPLVLMRSLSHAVWACTTEIPDREEELNLVRRTVTNIIGGFPSDRHPGLHHPRPPLAPSVF